MVRFLLTLMLLAGSGCSTRRTPEYQLPGGYSETYHQRLKETDLGVDAISPPPEISPLLSEASAFPEPLATGF